MIAGSWDREFDNYYINTELQTPYHGLIFSPYLRKEQKDVNISDLGVLAHQNINNFNISIGIAKQKIQGYGAQMEGNQILLGVETSVSKIDIGLQISRRSVESDLGADIGTERKTIIYELYAKYSLPQYRGSDIGDLKFMYQYEPSHPFVILENDVVTGQQPAPSEEAFAIFYKRNLTKNLSVELGTVKEGGEYDSIWKINAKF